MENLRRRSLEAFTTATEHVPARMLLNHNTNFYDTIASLTIVKENGWVYTFSVESYKILTDTTLIFFGSNDEELKYPADGSGWVLEGGDAGVRQEQSDVPIGRRLSTSSSLRGGSDEVPDFHRILSSKSSLCDASVDSPCKTCIESQDSWCAGSSWDQWCTSGCNGPTQYMATGCLNECSEPQIVSVKAKKVSEVEKEEPVDCKVGPWTAVTGSCVFSTGSTACLAKETRSIITQAAHGGQNCPAIEQDVACDCPKICGDGHVVPGEQCDDGDGYSGDGCSSSCTIEPGWSCSFVGGMSFNPSACTAQVCGDGIRSGTEECDDGNNIDNDGCTACEIDTWFDCSGAIGETTVCECMRVRKDYRDMRQDEKDLYIQAVNALKQSGVYDLLVQTHAHLPNKDYAHGTSGFLPWHRKYLLEYENALRALGDEYKCVTVPYWDWAEDTDLCSADGGCESYHSKSSILQDFGGPGSRACSTSPHSGTISCSSIPDGPWNKQTQQYDTELYRSTCTGTTLFKGGSCDGLETWGSTGAGAKMCNERQEKFEDCIDIDANAVGCVMTGPFAGWMSPAWPDDQTTTSTCLSRGINWDISEQGYLTGSQRLQQIIHDYPEYGSSRGFRAYIESTPHANPHNLLGGHIRSFSSPADPLFFSHHAYIDKVWSMWQNCHDHDEIHSSQADDPQYQATDESVDGRDVDLVFTFPADGPSENKCIKDVDADCTSCVHSNDGWCISNNWDSTCEGFCSSACASKCGSGQPDRAPEDVISTWDDSTLKPTDFHSIHDLGYIKAGLANAGMANSYLYAPDQFDLKMKSQKAICDYTETAHHGKEWKRRNLKSVPKDSRRLDANGRPERTEAETMKKIYEAAGEEVPRRYLTVEYNEYNCPRDNEAGWSSDIRIDGNTCLGGYVETADGYQEVCYCFCDDGLTWNMDFSECISIFPDNHENSDPDTDLIIEYYDNLAAELMAKDSFVKEADSLNRVMKDLVQRECELLYNSKSGIARNDTVREENSLKNRFLKGWGLQESIELGVADDPCDGVFAE